MSAYQSFAELVLNTVKDQDYRLDVHQPSQEMAIVAIHGGGIEPPTGELAAAIAGQEYSRYIFQALRASGNAQMRIPMTRYDEMRLRALLQHSQAAVALDGVPGVDQTVHLGGRNRLLREKLIESLQAAGFETGRLVAPGAAHNPARFYNWPQRGGVLIELPLAFRMALVTGPLEAFQREDSDSHSERFACLVEAIRQAMAVHLSEVRVDLDRTLDRFEQDTGRIPRSICSSKGHSHDHS